MRILVYPGTFDPVTNGHLDIINRASKLCDKLVVGVLVNDSKKPIFTKEERVDFIKRVSKDIPNVEITYFKGLLVDFVKEKKAKAIIKGLRAVSDYEYELQMAHINKKLSSEMETLFMMASAEFSFLSSSSVREIAKFGADLNGLIPEEIIDDVENKLMEINKK